MFYFEKSIWFFIQCESSIFCFSFAFFAFFFWENEKWDNSLLFFHLLSNDTLIGKPEKKKKKLFIFEKRIEKKICLRVKLWNNDVIAILFVKENKK